MDKKRNKRTESWLSLLTLIIVLIVVGIASQQWIHGRVDLTENNQFTLSKAAINTLENLPDLITIKLVMSKDLHRFVHT